MIFPSAHHGLDRRQAVPISRQVQVALIAVVVSLASTVLTNWFVKDTLDEVWRLTTRRANMWETLVGVEEVLSSFKDIETGTRGFAITGQETYLKPYNDATLSLPDAYAQLKHKTHLAGAADFPWGQLDALFKERLQLAAEVIKNRRALGKRALEEQLFFDDGKKAMDSLREQFAKLTQRQHQQIGEINAQLKLKQALADNYSKLNAVSNLLLALLTIFLIVREMHLRANLEGALRASNSQLEAKVTERTGALTQARHQLTEFALAQNHAVEAERRRVSREVHDQIGQVFTAIRLIVKSLPARSLPQGQAEAMDDALELGIKSARRITAELRPPLLDDLGLSAALTHFSTELTNQTGLKCSVHVDNSTAVSDAMALALFRIAQEATTNIVRHASASTVVIEGENTDTGYVFSIQDNGVGFAQGATRIGAMGLNSMRERAQLMGARLNIHTSAAGTRIAIHLPTPTAPQQSHDNADTAA